jgi:uncharacterized repeat protein (TIGR01451 family)
MICFWKFIKFLFNLGYSIVARIVIIGLLFSSGMLSQIVLAQDNGLNLIDSKIDDTSGVDGLSGTTSLDVSPDGLHLYATGFADNALAVFRRNIGTGQLTFVQTIKNSDIGNLGLKGANAILVSPDNKHVYVASTLDNAIVVFTRDTTTGQLTLVEIQQDSLNGGDGLGGASSLAISADNLRLYVTGFRDNALSVFDRDVNSGVLTFLQLQQDGVNGVDGLAGPTSVTVSQDNIFIYATGSSDHAVAIFTRNPSLGELAYVGSLTNGVGGTNGLNGAYDVAISPDNQHLYVASNSDSALVALSRDMSTGLLTFIATYQDGVSTINGLGGARALTLSPQGKTIFVASTNDNALSMFSRDPSTGLLNFNTAVVNNVGGVTTLDGATAVDTSPDSNYVYTSALFSHAVSGFSTNSTDLSVTMTAPDTVAINSTLTYLITVTNHSANQATGVTLTAKIPGTFASVQASQGTCHSTTQPISCDLGTLATQAHATVTLIINTPDTVTSESLTNTATVSAQQSDVDTGNNSVSVTTQLLESLPEADLTIEMSLATPTTTVNSAFNYTITVTNQGPEIASNVSVTSQLPAEVTYNATDSDNRCSESSGTITCQVGDSEVGASVQVPIHVIMPATTGEKSFTATVQSANTDSNSDNNTVTQPVAVIATQADLAITDALATPSTINVGDEFTYSITVVNNGTTTASGVTLTTQLPPQINYLADTANCTSAPPKITCEIGDMAISATQAITITAKASQTGTNILTPFSITSTTPDQNDNDNSKTVLINAITGFTADFVVTVDDGGQTVLLGNSMSYTIIVANNGNSDAPAELKVSLGGENVTVNSVKGTNCGSGTNFTCTFETVAVGENETVVVEATPTMVGNLVLTAEVTTTAFDPSLPNIATQQTAVSDQEADLVLTLAGAPNPAFLERNIQYTMTVTNNGPSQATGVILKQELPTSVTFISAQSNRGDSEICTPDTNTPQILNCVVGPLNIDETVTVVTEVTPQSTGQINSTVTVRSDRFDPVATNNTATVTIEVGQFQADLNLTVTDTPDPVMVGDTITYQITLNNNGPDPANAITILNTLPTQVTLQTLPTITPSEISGGCTEANAVGEISCTITSLPYQGTATISFSVLTNAAGVIANTTQLTAREFDPDEANNTVVTETRVNNPATLFFVSAQRDGLAGVQGLQGVMNVAISPDGQQVYAAGFSDNALVVFNRNSSTGQLNFAQVLRDDSNGIDGLANASAVALSPDGSFVYATGFTDRAVTVFRRETNGILSFIATYKNGNNGIDGLSGAFALVVTDGQVYVAGNSDDAIAVFNRNSETGELTFQQAIRFTEPTQNLDGINGLALTPDGLQLLATNFNANRLSVFNRDSNNGQLTLMQTLTNNTGGIQGLTQVNNVIVSPDGKHVYTVSGGTDNALTVFNRQTDTGELTLATLYRDGVDGIEGLESAAGLAISPNGTYLYVASPNDNALTAFQRDPDTGHLTFMDSRLDGVDEVDGLGGARSVVVSATGAHIYVAGFNDNAVAVLTVATADLSLSMTDSADPVNIGDNIAYTLKVTNNGPHSATQIQLADTLPSQVELISFNPSQGTCTPSAANDQLNCLLGNLKAGNQLTISIVVAANEPGELVNQAQVTAQEFDPNTNTASETTQVVARSDLRLTITASPEAAKIHSELTYTVTITNDGPDSAQAINLTTQLPVQVQWISARLGSENVSCPYDNNTRQVTCELSNLAAGASTTLELVVKPTTEGVVLTTVANISAVTADPTATNNRVTHTTEVSFNIISDTYDNQGQTLANYKIAPTGAVIGGSISGTINNQGLISNAHILPGTTVTGGGKLSKTITNEGTIDTAQLLSNTVINGGTVQGKITGFPTAPATLNAKIGSNTQLSHVILGAGSQLEASVTLGEGVRFASAGNIPPGINLTPTLPIIIEPITQSQAIDLTTDVVTNGHLLNAINAIPALQDNGLAFTQSLETGMMFLAVAEEHTVLLPVNVTQAAPGATPGITLHSDGSVTFIVAGGRQIFAQPAIQAPAALQTALANLGFTQFMVTTDGNLTIDAGSTQFKARPDLHTQASSPLLALGLQAVPSPLLQGLGEVVLRFVDNNQKWRQQNLYPVSVNAQEIGSLLQGFPGATAVTFYNNGKVSVKIGGRTYSGLFDYSVQIGSPTTVTQMIPMTDRNGDGSEDFQIVYTNGGQQMLYIMPFPEVAADIQTIPELQNQGYVVSQDINGNLSLVQGDTRLLLKTTSMVPLTNEQSPQLRISSDGSVEFITESGLQMLTQPQVQDMTALQDALTPLGISTVISENNGNLTLVSATGGTASARPDLEATTVAWLSMPLGLQALPTVLPGVLSAMLVFRDETGTKRQQNIYPAAKYPHEILSFLNNLPGITQVALDNNGILTVTGDNLAFRGIFAYGIEMDVATGSLQIIPQSDANGDGINDITVIYSSGEKQIIYQIPSF